jgi:hypothetical protein
VRIFPMRGTLTCRRSVSARPNAPVVNRHDIAVRLPLNRGNRTVRPRRVPVFDACQLPSAVARFARPDEYASFEFSAHHGATVLLAWFHHFRRLYADHDSDGVSCSAGTGVGRLRLPLVHRRRHQGESPGERVPLPAAVRPQHRVLLRGRVERESVRLDDSGHAGTSSAGSRRSW